MDATLAAKYDRQERDAPPVPAEPVFDLSQPPSTRWNQANIAQMITPLRVQLEVSQEMYSHEFKARGDDFFKHQLSTMLGNFRTTWSLVQPKAKQDGTVESQEEALARAGAQLSYQDQASRAGGRRRDVSNRRS
jgi:hypothetical protein